MIFWTKYSMLFTSWVGFLILISHIKILFHFDLFVLWFTLDRCYKDLSRFILNYRFVDYSAIRGKYWVKIFVLHIFLTIFTYELSYYFLYISVNSSKYKSIYVACNPSKHLSLKPKRPNGICTVVYLLCHAKSLVFNRVIIIWMCW